MLRGSDRGDYHLYDHGLLFLSFLLTRISSRLPGWTRSGDDGCHLIRSLHVNNPFALASGMGGLTLLGRCRWAGWQAALGAVFQSR